MASNTESNLHTLDEDAALRMIMEGTATETGERFFRALVKSVSKALDTKGAWVTEYLKESERLRSFAFWFDGDWIEECEYDVKGTPCQTVIEEARLVHIPENVVALYPDDPDLDPQGAVSFMGVPLTDTNGEVLGHLAVVDSKPLPKLPKAITIFRIFAARACAEILRLRAEAEVREREKELGSLVDSAMDAIIELNNMLEVSMLNPAAEKVFQTKISENERRSFLEFLSDESGEKLRNIIGELAVLPEGQRYIWIAGGLAGREAGGGTFKAEATISQFEMQGKRFYTLILRNINERLEAEKRIKMLSREADYLREEINSLQNFGEIIGNCPALLKVLSNINKVAGTDATVLISGETGTGKELIARAIHAGSGRRDKPLIKVNCAAIPRGLIESEFFGHEKGSFTGASGKREGRFSLADGGTIFLDEIGELPLDLQSKLLRVLQEGEFEPVGSSKTRKVNVRVLAATNRDLNREVKEGKFREDLYYRLNVFPLTVPPLRERGEDIIKLASVFAEKFASKIGISVRPLTQDQIERMMAYSWPGNIRELQNVIERAVITAQGGGLNLDQALPVTSLNRDSSEERSKAAPGKRVLTQKELQDLERENIIAALEKASWKVSGEKGAASLLGIPHTTLSSRIKALGIKRP
ncbi:MAG: sigma 54-interacting transcriptional regulator [Deltaproteobacteria bacterium]